MEFKPSRREFLQAGLALPVTSFVSVDSLSFSPQTPAGAGYRTLGKTGLRVSGVGSGVGIIPDPQVIRRAIDLGVNYFDTARGYGEGKSEQITGTALKGRRDKVVLATKTDGRTKAEILKDMDASLKALQTDHVDIWHLHSRDTPDTITDEAVEACEILKKQGKTRFIGVSAHDINAVVDKILKVGKFELDNLFSEKRFTWLSNNGGFLYAYHYEPVGSVDSYAFGLGDNQIGAEFSGHSINSYTRYSVSLLTTDDGEAGLPGGKSMDAMVSLSQAWAMGAGLGPTRVGLFGYLGHRPTAIETIGGEPIPGTGSANKSFLRIGATAQVWLGNLELVPLVTHAQDDAALGGSTEKPAWNTALLEAHYVATPRLMVQGRYELLRMSKQADPAIPKSFGNADAFALGFRAYPFLFSRDGMAIHGEFALTNTTGMAPLSGDGSGVDAADPATKIRSLSFLLAFDFAF